MADPGLDPETRTRLVAELMIARRSVARSKRAGDASGEHDAHAAVDAAKCALGERGPVWWDDSTPDLNRHLARTGPYAGWYASLVSSSD